MNDSHEHFAHWDGAYLLGALKPEVRLEYESHLDACPRCADSLASIAGLPGLLRAVPPETAHALLQDSAAQPAGDPPQDLLARMRDRNRKRRRTIRTRVVAGLAAAAVLAGVIALPALTESTSTSVSTTLAQTQGSPLSASIRLSELDWGTRLSIDCNYDSGATWEVKQPSTGAWRFALFVIDDEGNETQVSSWKAEPGDAVSVLASTVLTVEQIRSLEIRSLATGDTLMSANVPS